MSPQMLFFAIMLIALQAVACAPSRVQTLSGLKMADDLEHRELRDQAIVIAPPTIHGDVSWSSSARELLQMELAKRLANTADLPHTIIVRNPLDLDQYDDHWILHTRIVIDEVSYSQSSETNREGEKKDWSETLTYTTKREVGLSIALASPETERPELLGLARDYGSNSTSYTRKESDSFFVELVSSAFRDYPSPPAAHSFAPTLAQIVAHSFPTPAHANFGRCRVRMYHGGPTPHRWFFANRCNRAIKRCIAQAKSEGRGAWRCEKV